MGWSLLPQDTETMSYTIKRASIIDALRFAPVLRMADIRECLAASGLQPEEALKLSVNESDQAFAVYSTLDHTPLCLFGVGPHESFGVPWLVGTDS